jgi:hypothetical protein
MMKKINPRSLAIIVTIVAMQIGFVLFELLVYWMTRTNLVLSTTTILILNISKIFSLIVGVGWSIWLLRYKYHTAYTWRDSLPFILALLLIEYWYFVVRLLSSVN